MKVWSVYDRIQGAGMVLVCALLGFTMLLICADVIMRYALNRPIAWSLEICEFSLVFMVSLGMAQLLREEGHVRIDVVLNLLKPRHRSLLNGITSALNTVPLLIVTVYGLQFIAFIIEKGVVEKGVLGIPKAAILIPLVIGCFLFSIQFARRSHSFLKSWKTGEG